MDHALEDAHVALAEADGRVPAAGIGGDGVLGLGRDRVAELGRLGLEDDHLDFRQKGVR